MPLNRPEKVQAGPYFALSAQRRGGLTVAWIHLQRPIFHGCFGWRMGSTGSCCMSVTADMRPWVSSELLLLFVMWAVMMVAMMAPTAAPMVLTFAAVNRRRRAVQKPYVPTSFFLLGYLLAWFIFS